MSCVKPLQHLLSERHNEMAIYEAVVNRVSITAINAITVLLNFTSEKLLFGHDDTMNKVEMKFA